MFFIFDRANLERAYKSFPSSRSGLRFTALYSMLEKKSYNVYLFAPIQDISFIDP